jgi:hypothetical protein
MRTYMCRSGIGVLVFSFIVMKRYLHCNKFVYIDESNVVVLYDEFPCDYLM